MLSVVKKVSENPWNAEAPYPANHRDARLLEIFSLMITHTSNQPTNWGVETSSASPTVASTPLIVSTHLTTLLIPKILHSCGIPSVTWNKFPCTPNHDRPLLMDVEALPARRTNELFVRYAWSPSRNVRNCRLSWDSLFWIVVVVVVSPSSLLSFFTSST